MAKCRGRKPVKKAPTSPEPDFNAEESKEPQIDDKEAALLREEVERRSAAVRAIRDMEIENSLTGLRLLRSYFDEKQLQTPVLQFFKENLPNLSVVRSEENGHVELQWKDIYGNVSMENADGRDIHASLLRRMSVTYPSCSVAPSFGGYELSTKSVKTSFLGGDKLQIRDFVLEEPSDSEMLGVHDALQTPGANSQRLSFGMTPKTRRLPKPGEMLLSVHGSPLGVFKEDNMEAIHESEET